MLRLLSFACVLHAIINVQVSGTVMELIPNPVILGQNGTLAMNCFLDNTEKGTSIKALSTVTILRNSTRENGQEEAAVVAQTLYGNDPSTGVPIVVAELGEVPDVQSRRPTVTGDMKKLPTENIAEVRLTWDAKGIVCEDMGSYQCHVQYTDINNRNAEWTSTSELRPLSYPANLVMTVQGKSNIPGFPPQNTDEGQMENTALEFNEGDTVDMQCTGVIGNDRNTKIKWYRTRDFSEDPDDLQRFNGPTLDEGIVPEEMVNCRYSRTSTVKYNVTEMDAARTRPFMFLCRIEYTMNGVAMHIDGDRKVFIHAGTASGSGTAGQVASAGGGGDAGIIAGSVVGALVFIVLIVVLVYFLWYRKRSDGETYSSGGRNQNETGMLGFNKDRTKEERGADDPNMVPTTVEYAVPHKERKAYDNDAMDDNDRSHSSKNDYRDRHRDDRDGYRDRHRDRYDRDGGHHGRANYGMENDSDASPSMTPRGINHMGVGEDGSVGTGV